MLFNLLKNKEQNDLPVTKNLSLTLINKPVNIVNASRIGKRN